LLPYLISQQEFEMTATRRGANNKISAFLRRREDAQRLQEAPEEAQGSYPKAQAEVTVEVSDAEKAALEVYTVNQLKERLVSLNLPITGKKADLIARLLEAGS